MSNESRHDGANTGSSRGNDPHPDFPSLLKRVVALHRIEPTAATQIVWDWICGEVIAMPDGWKDPSLCVWGSDERPHRPNVQPGTPRRTTLNLLPGRESWRSDPRARWALKLASHIDRLRAQRKAVMTDPRYPFTDTCPLMDGDTRIGVVRLYAKTEDLLRRGIACVEDDKVDPRLEDQTAWVVLDNGEGLRFNRYKPPEPATTRDAPAHQPPATNPGNDAWDSEFDTDEADKDRLVLIARRKQRTLAWALVLVLPALLVMGWGWHNANKSNAAAIADLSEQLVESKRRVSELERAPTLDNAQDPVITVLRAAQRDRQQEISDHLSGIQTQVYEGQRMVPYQGDVYDHLSRQVYRPLRRYRGELRENRIVIDETVIQALVEYGAGQRAAGRQELLEEQKPQQRLVTLPSRKAEAPSQQRLVSLPPRSRPD